MADPAVSAHRQQTAARIVRCAQELAEQRGLDGFTMDDLAERAGVSRRTLFNYVSGKFDAVLGAPPSPDPSRLDEFRRGGPTGELGEDVKAVITAVLDSRDVARDDLERIRRFVASDPRLFQAMHDKFAVVADFFTEAILHREGSDFGLLRARGAARVTLAVFDVALDAYVEDPSISLVDHYATAFDGARALLR